MKVSRTFTAFSLFLLLFCSNALAADPPYCYSEADGSPNYCLKKLQFPNGTLSLSGNQAVYTPVYTLNGVTDPNADRIVFWDDSSGLLDFLAPDGTTVVISGTTLSATASASGWTDGGANITQVASTDNVGVGGTPLGKLSVIGDTDEAQLHVKFHSTQTTAPILFEAQDGTDRLSLSNAGVLTVSGSGTGGLELSNGATSAGNVVLYEDNDNGSNKTTIIGASSMSSDKTITLPDETGTVCTTGSVCSGYDATTTAGDYLTKTANDFDVDAEVITDTKCVWWENPVAGDDFKSVFVNDMPTTITVTKLWCESDQTVNMMFQVDDGTPADMDSVDLACISTPDTDISLDGDPTVAAGERVDVDVASVSGTPTWVSACFTYTKAD